MVIRAEVAPRPAQDGWRGPDGSFGPITPGELAGGPERVEAIVLRSDVNPAVGRDRGRGIHSTACRIGPGGEPVGRIARGDDACVRPQADRAIGYNSGGTVQVVCLASAPHPFSRGRERPEPIVL